MCRGQRASPAGSSIAAGGPRSAEQAEADTARGAGASWKKHGRVVVKPARGEMGDRVSVDCAIAKTWEAAVEPPAGCRRTSFVEEYVTGDDLRSS